MPRGIGCCNTNPLLFDISAFKLRSPYQDMYFRLDHADTTEVVRTARYRWFFWVVYRQPCATDADLDTMQLPLRDEWSSEFLGGRLYLTRSSD